MGYKEAYYFQTDFLCIVILIYILIIWASQKKDISTGRRIIKTTVLLSMLFCAADLVAGVTEGMDFGLNTFVIYLSNIIYYLTSMLIAYAWMLYSLMRIGKLESTKNKTLFLLFMPTILFGVFLCTTPWHHLVFKVVDGYYSRGNFVFLHWAIALIYIIYGIVQISIAIAKEKSKVKRSEYRTILAFPAMPVLMLAVQAIFSGLSTVQMGLTFAILMLFCGEQNSMIQTDDLTKLNNRRSLDNYIESHLGHLSTSVEFTFMMVDINRFKEINDNYGHIMGDQILKNVSSVLKTACESSPKRVFLCRYGGDEFLIVGVDLSYDEVSVIKESIVRGMRNKLQYDSIDFQITASIGVAKGRCRDVEDTEHLIRVADEDMYEEKKNYRYQ